MPTPSISTLITFTAGTTILAAEANQNFADIRQAFNNHWHPAEEVGPGTFRTGPFVFNGALTVNGTITGQLDAGNLVAGTIPDGRFPAVLPAASGANLTNLNGSNISSGTVALDRLPAGVALYGVAGTFTFAQQFIAPLATDVVLAARRNTDTVARVAVLADGSLVFGNGTDAVDAVFGRAGVNRLAVGGHLNVNGLAYTWPSAHPAVAGRPLIQNGSGAMTWGGATTLDAVTVDNGQAVIAERDLGTVGATVAVDFSLRNNVRMVLSANVTNLTLSGGVNGGVYTMFIEHNGAFTISSWPANVRWDLGSAPTLTTGANRGSLVSFYFRGGRYHAALVATNLNLA